MAYSDAVTSAREAAVQTGFELGLQQAVACGRQLGRLEGICRYVSRPPRKPRFVTIPC